MGLLEDYAPDLEQIEVPSWEVPDGNYPFVVGSAAIVVGTRKEPDAVNFVFKFLLGEAGKPKDEWFRLPENPSAPTDKEKEKLGYLKVRLLSLGIPENQHNTVTEDDLVGIEGNLSLLTKNGYQNIRSLTLEDDGENAFQKPAAPVEAATPVAPKPRRTRRTKEQIAADNAAAAAPAPTQSVDTSAEGAESVPQGKLSDEEIEAQLEAEEAVEAAKAAAQAALAAQSEAPAAPAASPVEAIEESDADRKARIIARRKARAAEAAASAPADAGDNPFGA